MIINSYFELTNWGKETELVVEKHTKVCLKNCTVDNNIERAGKNQGTTVDNTVDTSEEKQWIK